MSPKNQPNRAKESSISSQLKSSIIHKPFETGTINIFNPYRNKNKTNDKTNDRLAVPKLYLDAQLEATQLDTSAEVDDHQSNWLDRLLNPWSVSAIAIIFLANLISGAVIWRNSRSLTSVKPVEAIASLESANLASEEFMPLNLSTLSQLKMTEDLTVSTLVAPIIPALAPINLAQSTIDPQYYYLLTEYHGDSSLALAKQKVEQVSLVNLPQGIFIYLGAYKDRAQAEQFIAHLKQENLAAHIYPLD
jgi:hypothetical protein